MTAQPRSDAGAKKAQSGRAAVSKAESHNLYGQKIGRKGRVTRERILEATAELLADPDEPINLSAVARRAGLGMTSLYLYFKDLTELLLAILDPIMATADEEYLRQIGEHWPDEELEQHADEFLRRYFAFWTKHARILHLRNSLSESGGDARMAQQRLIAGTPLIRSLTLQMHGDPDRLNSSDYAMGTVLFSGIDRLMAVRTLSAEWSIGARSDFFPSLDLQLAAQARVITLVIRDARQTRASRTA